MQRLIFTLLYDRGQFMLSRNFRLQQVGDLEWLLRNYDFGQVSRGIDELMVLNVSRGKHNEEDFCKSVLHISSQCFIPLTVGGRIRSFQTAQRYMKHGADKLLLNSAFDSDPELAMRLSRHYGSQCIVAGTDFRSDENGDRIVFTENGEKQSAYSLPDRIKHLQTAGAGEIILQSIERDGTGMGLDISVTNDLKEQLHVPCILMGGVGKADQIIQGLKADMVDAVATANLFNFIGSAFLDVRKAVSSAGIDVPNWKADDFTALRGSANQQF